MGLLDDIQKPRNNRVQCNVQKLSDQLEPADQTKLAQLIADMTWSSAALSKALAIKGLTIGHQSIRRHRAKDCSCSKI